MKPKYKRIILVGEGGSGKDYMRKLLVDSGFDYGISVTTRPPRENEVNGVDYYFITRQQAESYYIPHELFYEYVYFNGWLYGSLKEDFLSANLFIMTPSGIDALEEHDRNESFIIYIKIDEDIRRERLGNRNDCDKIERRLQSDNNDFKHFKDYDLVITNPNFTLSDISENILEIKNNRLW